MKKIFIILFCCFLISLCFFFTVQERSEWFTKLLNGHLCRETAHSVCVTKYWLKEGALNLKFLYISKPDLPEFDSIQDRGPYVSYPPGSLLPVFILANIFHPERLVFIHLSYNLATQYLIAILLFLLMFMILDYFKEAKEVNLFFSIVPSLIYLYTPSTLYWHLVVYFADQAVMVLFALFVYLEMKRYLYKGLSGFSSLIFMGVVFLGTFTDWLFVFVIFVTILLRTFFDNKPEFSWRSISRIRDLIVPAGLALLLFLYQIIPLGLFGNLFTAFNRRGFSSPGGTGINLFVQHFYNFVVQMNSYVLCGVAIFCSIFLLLYFLASKLKKEKSGNEDILKVYTRLAILVIFPCFLQVYIFRQHSAVHDFSALKWSLPLALIPFGIFPVLFNRLIKPYRYHKLILDVFIVFYILLLVLGVFYRTPYLYNYLFQLWEGRDKEISQLYKGIPESKDPCFYLFLK